MSKTRESRRAEAERFYTTHCPGRLEEVDFIDFTYSVRDVRIPRGTCLVGFKDPRVSPLKTSFFCLPGTPVSILGVHHSSSLRTNPKVILKTMNVYEVLVEVPHALETVCADGIDQWSLAGGLKPIPVSGGGWQYKIPEAHRYLRCIPPSEMAARAR